MTSPISNNSINVANQRLIDRPEKSVGGNKSGETATVAPETPSASPQNTNLEDRLELSEAAKKFSEDSFDKEKVSAIKEALRNGNYPLDSKKIAESFYALEKLL